MREIFFCNAASAGATIPHGEAPSDWITGPVERIGSTYIFRSFCRQALAVANPVPSINPPYWLLDLLRDEGDIT
ncbi:hypothetical protein [Sinorhizobium sp. RAC02]|uniref:hypothetical protein n=1 Tax=Sinorhizobium sp. RAC02 TaxID=1842534 RepID=UPI00123717F1|nr:hypothetical protein [Sinorhizobium sp. RAC02]